ncbi:MAG: formate dehydrogenase accessory sulfurtransferase FdhD [Telmatospirillum sp.]|nr:formate dehydrogenase accessory sulfurtransferase FdhD [Telmatospirillum sp.]
MTRPSRPATPPPPGAQRVEAIRFTGSDPAPRQEIVADEVPVSLVFNRFPFAVMLATPVDLEDLAVGFSLTEGIVTDPATVRDVHVRDAGEGVEVSMTIDRDNYMGLRERHRRTLMAGSSCGLCGTDSVEEALRPVDPIVSARRFRPQAISRAMAGLPGLQVMNRDVGAFHAAAFADPDGELLLVREDVGRHNALDKLIGAMARAGIDRDAGFAAVSSRCSYEMARKTAAAGIPLIATVSAPTALAITLAGEVGLGLVAFARDNRFNLYAMPSRIGGEGGRLSLSPGSPGSPLSPKG